MKRTSIHIFLFLITTSFYEISSACPSADTIPACILKMKQEDSLLIVEQYNYKDQQWFSIRKVLSEMELKKADFINSIVFYNLRCNRVATWRTGGKGVIPINEILPDTIDKTKLQKVADPIVPEKILKLAIQNNAASITEFEYLGQELYFLNKFTERYNINAQKEMVSKEIYYDKNGIEVIRFQRANAASFMRAQGWRPVTVKPEMLFKKGIIWNNLPNKI